MCFYQTAIEFQLNLQADYEMIDLKWTAKNVCLLKYKFILYKWFFRVK